MPIKDWIPIAQLRSIVRHFITVIAIGLAIGGANQGFVIVVPSMAGSAELIESIVLYGLLCVLGATLLWEFWRGDGSYHAFAAV